MNYHAPFRLTTLGAFILSLSACGGGGGGSGTVPTTASDYTPTTTTPTTTTTTTATSTSTVAPIAYCCDSATAPATLTETLQLNGGVSNGFAITTHLSLQGTSSDPSSVTGGGTGANPASVTVNPSGAVNTLTLSTVNAAAWSNTKVYDDTAPTADRVILWFDVKDAWALLDFTDWTDPNNIQIAHIYFDTGAADQPDATVPKYQYMAWGWWLTSDYATTDAMIDTVEGFFVVGKPTDPANIPTIGTATYAGETFGQALDGATYGTFNATADFQNRQIAVSSTGTVLDTGSATVAASQYDFGGTLTYAAGVNQFGGAISNPDSGMRGTATGMFYGPAAEEIGGVFEMTNGALAAKGLFVAN
jgi:hypothetical protein